MYRCNWEIFFWKVSYLKKLMWNKHRRFKKNLKRCTFSNASVLRNRGHPSKYDKTWNIFKSNMINQYAYDFYDFSICNLAAPRSTLGHYRRRQLHWHDINQCILPIFNRKVFGSLVTRLGPYACPSA